jgi:hypothetical protein
VGLLSRLRTRDGRGDQPADRTGPSSPPAPVATPAPITAADLAELAVPGWARVPPPPPLLDPMPLVVATDFETSLPSRRRPDPVLVRPLGHLIAPEGPAGTVEGLAVARPVEAPAAVPAAPVPPPDLVLTRPVPPSDPEPANGSAPPRPRPILTSSPAVPAPSAPVPAPAPRRFAEPEPAAGGPAAPSPGAGPDPSPERVIGAPGPSPVVIPEDSGGGPADLALAAPARPAPPRTDPPAPGRMVTAGVPKSLPLTALPVSPGPLPVTAIPAPPAGASRRERAVAAAAEPSGPGDPDAPAPYLDLATPSGRNGARVPAAPGGGTVHRNGTTPEGPNPPTGGPDPRPTAPLVGEAPLAPAGPGPAPTDGRPVADRANDGDHPDLTLPGRTPRAADRRAPVPPPDRGAAPAAPGLGRPIGGLPPTAVPMDKLRLAEASGMRVRVVGSDDGDRGPRLPLAGPPGQRPTPPGAGPLPAISPPPAVPVIAPPAPPAPPAPRPVGPWPAVRPEPPAVRRRSPARVAPLVAARRLSPRLREGQGVKDAVGRQFGVDLSAVPIDRSAAATAESAGLGATAFTDGRGVHIPARVGSLDSSTGRAVLAHELTHVAQRMAHPGPVPAESSPLGRTLERQATRVQQAVAAAPAGGVASALAAAVDAPARLPARPPSGAPVAPSGGRATNGREAPGSRPAALPAAAPAPRPGPVTPAARLDPGPPVAPVVLSVPGRSTATAGAPVAASRAASGPGARVAAGPALAAPAAAAAPPAPVARPVPAVEPAVMDAVMSRLGNVEALADQLLARQSAPITAHAPGAATGAVAPTTVPSGPVQRICEPGSSSDTHSHVVPPSPKELEKLARLLFPILRHELRAGLREDRDRSGLLTDMYGSW